MEKDKAMCKVSGNRAERWKLSIKSELTCAPQPLAIGPFVHPVSVKALIAILESKEMNYTGESHKRESVHITERASCRCSAEKLPSSIGHSGKVLIVRKKETSPVFLSPSLGPIFHIDKEPQRC
jgi:hypothetical protein